MREQISRKNGCCCAKTSTSEARGFSRKSISPLALSSPMVQAKLKVGAPNDRYEQEADRIADQVMRVSDTQVQRKSEGKITHLKSIANQVSPLVQRQFSIQEQGYAETGANYENGLRDVLISNLESEVFTRLGQGQPLEQDTRDLMERLFGVGFNNIEIHTDIRADRLNHALHSRAFTFGNAIFFRQGEYQPKSQTGQKLIAHELTHTLQQKHSVQAVQRDKMPGNVSPTSAFLLLGFAPSPTVALRPGALNMNRTHAAGYRPFERSKQSAKANKIKWLHSRPWITLSPGGKSPSFITKAGVQRVLVSGKTMASYQKYEYHILDHVKHMVKEASSVSDIKSIAKHITQLYKSVSFQFPQRFYNNRGPQQLLQTFLTELRMKGQKYESLMNAVHNLLFLESVKLDISREFKDVRHFGLETSKKIFMFLEKYKESYDDFSDMFEKYETPHAGKKAKKKKKKSSKESEGTIEIELPKPYPRYRYSRTLEKGTSKEKNSKNPCDLMGLSGDYPAQTSYFWIRHPYQLVTKNETLIYQKTLWVLALIRPNPAGKGTGNNTNRLTKRYLYIRDILGNIILDKNSFRIPHRSSNILIPRLPSPPSKTLSGIRKRVGIPGDTAGHIIGDQFGGRGDNLDAIQKWGNLFPQETKSNSNDYRQLEDEIARLSKAKGKPVCVSINFSRFFTDSDFPLRPTGFKVSYWIDDLYKHKTIQNPHP